MPKKDNCVKEHRSIADILLHAAETWPDAGVCWASDKGSVFSFQSYTSLLEVAQRALGGLQSHGLRPGDRVVLFIDDPGEFVPVFWGCVLGGFVPCPVATADRGQGAWLAQLQHLDELLGKPLIAVSQGIRDSRVFAPGLRLANVSELLRGPPVVTCYDVKADTPAMLVLTSGSTGTAKAVCLTHANLLSAMPAKAERHALTHRDVSLNWVSFDHVAALLECHMLPLYVGARQVQCMPQDIIRSPLRFLERMAQFGITMTFTPNFLLGQVNRAIAQDGIPRGLDLSCVRQIISGGEAIVTATARQFLDALAPHGLSPHAIWPAFGMTETCAGSIYSREFPDIDGAEEFASLGTPIRGLEVRVIDETGSPAAEGQVGELQMRGPMVFRGYFNNPQATACAFTADGWFHTGDRGSLSAGRLRLAGRSKDSIIVNGVNYYAHEIEATLDGLDGLQGSFTAAFPTRQKGRDTEELVIVFAPGPAPQTDASLHRLIVTIRQTVLLRWGFLPGLVLPLPTEEIPKTSLGKIQRSLLRGRLEFGQLSAHVRRTVELLDCAASEYVPPAGDIEQALVRICSQVFGVRPEQMSVLASFQELGGTSIEILGLKARLEEEFPECSLTLASLLGASTIRSLAQCLAGRAAGAYDPLVVMQSRGPGVPLFCIHPGVGDVLVFLGLARHFQGERPVYALRARGFGPGERCFEMFDEMVWQYFAAIRKVQPTGPYALLGYSFGGVVAFELAKALEKAGERVAFLGLINVPPDIAAGRQSIDFAYTAVNLAFLLSLIAPEHVHELTEELRAVPDRRELVARLLARVQLRRLLELDLDLPRFSRWVDVAYSLVELGRQYEPRGLVESMNIYYAAPPVRYRDLPKHAWLRDRLQAWDAFSRQPVQYMELAGEHQSVLGEHLDEFQQMLRSHLATQPGSSVRAVPAKECDRSALWQGADREAGGRRTLRSAEGAAQDSGGAA